MGAWRPADVPEAQIGITRVGDVVQHLVLIGSLVHVEAFRGTNFVPAGQAEFIEPQNIPISTE